MTQSTSFIELENAVLQLDASAPNCRLKIAELRIEMDKFCDEGIITILQWRVLLDRVALVQSKCK